MNDNTRVYSPLPPAAYAALQQRANANGIPLEGNQGEVTRSGVCLRWSYDPAAGALTVTCVGKPFLVSFGRVFDTLAGWLGGGHE